MRSVAKGHGPLIDIDLEGQPHHLVQVVVLILERSLTRVLPLVWRLYSDGLRRLFISLFLHVAIQSLFSLNAHGRI